MTEAEARVRPDDTDTVPADSAPEAPPAATPPAVDNALPDDRYLNRELSWLDFNARVLALAADTSLPLLERAKFLAIFASNLDEFYMVRVAGLKRRDEMGLSVRSADGLSPREQLRRISERTQQIASRHARRVHRIRSARRSPTRASSSSRGPSSTTPNADELSAYFHEQVFPVLTPLAVDPAHPFPFVSGLSLNLAITVKHPDDGGQHFARIKVPDNVDRFVELDSRDGRRRAVPADGGADRGLPAGVVPRPGDRRASRVPHHPQRRHGSRRGPRRRPAAGARAGVGPSAIRLSGAARSRRRHDREHAGTAAARARREPR